MRDDSPTGGPSLFIELCVTFKAFTDRRLCVLLHDAVAHHSTALAPLTHTHSWDNRNNSNDLSVIIDEWFPWQPEQWWQCVISVRRKITHSHSPHVLLIALIGLKNHGGIYFGRIQASGMTSVKTWRVLFWICLWVWQRHEWRPKRPDWWIYSVICHQELGERGKSAFYQGRVAQAIVDVIKENGGVLTLEDLGSHDSEVMSPVSTPYKVRSVTLGADCICRLRTHLAKGTYCVFRGCGCGSLLQTARDWLRCCCSTSWRTSLSEVLREFDRKSFGSWML